MKKKVNNYFKRLITVPKKWELVFWWILRGSMLVAMIDSAFGLGIVRNEPDIQQVLQTGANLVAMFIWEIGQLFSRKRWPRYYPTYLQDVLSPLVWGASFGGAYLNWYYSINSWDIILHVTLGGFAVIMGYELVTCIQKRDKKYVYVNIALLCALGVSFLGCTGWEIFEFTFDQIAGGDSQHWSKALAEEAAILYNNPHLASPNVIPELDPMRYAVIDTMEDTLCNVVGGLIVYIGLRIKPYNHTGKNNVNKLAEENIKATVNI